MGVKYGWGGIDGGRDCSSTIKDLLTPFGIWLPRDSKDQYRRRRSKTGKWKSRGKIINHPGRGPALPDHHLQKGPLHVVHWAGC